jgi:hypothetical protein
LYGISSQFRPLRLSHYYSLNYSFALKDIKKPPPESPIINHPIQFPSKDATQLIRATTPNVYMNTATILALQRIYRDIAFSQASQSPDFLPNLLQASIHCLGRHPCEWKKGTG